MSILITGGTGFIGAEIVRQLLARGESEIHVLHRSGNFQRLQDVVDRLDLVQIDLADTDRLGEVVEASRPQVIYHLGAILTGPGEENPQAAVAANANPGPGDGLRYKPGFLHLRSTSDFP